MSLRDWLDSRWIVRHDPDPAEVAELFGVVTRDLQDAAVPRLSADWRLGIAYNAALQLATMALVAEGYRTGRERAHERTIQSLRYTVGIPQARIDLVDAVRRKRNLINYEHAGTTSDSEAAEFHSAVIALRGDVIDWLRRKHRVLLPPDIDI
jgi:hypothetical protein